MCVSPFPPPFPHTPLYSLTASGGLPSPLFAFATLPLFPFGWVRTGTGLGWLDRIYLCPSPTYLPPSPTMQPFPHPHTFVPAFIFPPPLHFCPLPFLAPSHTAPIACLAPLPLPFSPFPHPHTPPSPHFYPTHTPPHTPTHSPFPQHLPTPFTFPHPHTPTFPSPLPPYPLCPVSGLVVVRCSFDWVVVPSFSSYCPLVDCWLAAAALAPCRPCPTFCLAQRSRQFAPFLPSPTPLPPCPGALPVLQLGCWCCCFGWMVQVHLTLPQPPYTFNQVNSLG